MPTLNKYWKQEKNNRQKKLDGVDAEKQPANTLAKVLRENKEERELYERNQPSFKESERDTVRRINEHGFLEAYLRTDGNPFDVLDIALSSKEANKSKVAIAYVDNEWRPSATNRNKWDSANPQFPFFKIHIPVEKIKYFKIEKNRSFYIVRSPNNEDGIGFVISGKYIVDSYNRGIVDRAYHTRMGKRTFVLVERDKGTSGRFNTLMDYIIASLCEENVHVRAKYETWVNNTPITTKKQESNVSKTLSRNAWCPYNVGDYIAGKILSINKDGRYGIEARIIEDDEDQEGVLLPTHKLLQARIALLDVGDIVKITYIGTERMKNGRDAKSYKVVRKHK